MMNEFGPFGWGGGFGWIVMILFWLLILAGLIAIVKWLIGGPETNVPLPPSKTARQILEERYARGEIDREEFEQKKRDIES
ncbi:SHOCT domain-containing protein [Thiohalophilus thiocyanatoxydans]|uniref:Putative membrane protein n=1 Tax=Thiohalophilus thiocyanatoxydans TaxID=381308 RepID=A0A4R8IPH5_9GAMM|nr:SHOCT domain-containing protein [Thiohalophilus thiocyanatoxydans]TDY02831.1 putative membrane protein [Thiohalophilus thiocyanatoxydans]